MLSKGKSIQGIGTWKAVKGSHQGKCRFLLECQDIKSSALFDCDNLDALESSKTRHDKHTRHPLQRCLKHSQNSRRYVRLGLMLISFAKAL